jgi:SAM-dependent methyltransferase
MPAIDRLSRFAHKPLPDKGRAIKATIQDPYSASTPSIPETEANFTKHPWFKAAKRALMLAFPTGLEGRRIVDLGCGEGKYTIEFAKLGMEALGIEIRHSNVAKCLAVKEEISLTNLSFSRDTVWNLAKYGEFDAIFCCGLLYHLDRPREFIRLASGLCKTICLYQTHFATEREIGKFDLSPLMENEGVKGRWYKEHLATSVMGLEKQIWSAWDNERSFWLLREELLSLINENGFDMVFEQYDCLLPHLSEDRLGISTERSTISKEMTSGYYATDNRCLFVGIRTGIDSVREAAP